MSNLVICFQMKLKWSQTSHVQTDRINRFVPTPGGVTIGAVVKFIPALDMVHREDLNPNFPRLDDIQGQVVKGSMFKGGMGSTCKSTEAKKSSAGETFASRDVRSHPQ